MNEQRNNGRGIFYGVIGVATLVVAIVGATFAYFTATAYTTEKNITGNMATVSLGLAVEKVTHVDEAGGMVPMSSGMVEAAVNNTSNEICVDDSGNAVCQVYKITVSNTSSAAQFVDGYLALKGGSGTANDVTTWKNAAADASLTSDGRTTMRWAQVFPTTEDAGSVAWSDKRNFTTVGTQDLGGAGYTHSYANLGLDGAFGGSDTNADASKIASKLAFTTLKNESDGKNLSNIVETGENNAGYNSVVGGATIFGSDYVILGKNYVRVSDHAWATEGSESYSRQNDITSALVFNQYLVANTGSAEFYIVLWLAETGTNQTADKTENTLNNTDADSFFSGNVTFNSATGSEVSASFSGLTKAYTRS